MSELTREQVERMRKNGVVWNIYEVLDSHESLRRNVRRKPSHELGCLHRESSDPVVMTVVAPPERDFVILVRLDPFVGDRHTIGIPGQVCE